MASELAVEMVRELYAYHHWANRRLWRVVADLPPGVAEKPVGAQFSFPTLKGMLAHCYGADAAWLERWKGRSPDRLAGDADFPTLADLRARWDELERAQQAFVTALGPADLERVVEYRNTSGRAFAAPLWTLLQHVANHATHHRSELATMLTIVSGSPPATDLIVHHLVKTGQVS